MSDYRVRITVRNARLLRAIELAGHRPGVQFAQAAGISYGGELLPYLNFPRSPLQAEGLLRDSAWALCDFLGASPDELWSDEQLTPLARNTAQVDVSMAQLKTLIGGRSMNVEDPLVLAGRHETTALIETALKTISPREATVLRYRFGLGTEQQTLEEVAKMLRISRDRVRQIEAKGLRKLRVPSRQIAEIASVFDMNVTKNKSFSLSNKGEVHA